MKYSAFSLLIILFSCTNSSKEIPMLEYPVTQKLVVADTFHGTVVQDPYRWLENDTLKKTKDWVKAQNNLTEEYLSKIPYRNKIKERLTFHLNYERIFTPFHEGNYYYYYKNNGLEKQNVLYRADLEMKNEELFLDPNSFSEDATSTILEISFSKDGSLLALLLSEGGSDWASIVVMDTKSKKMLPDTLRNIKYSYMGWQGNEGFFYTTYDAPETSQFSSKDQNHTLYFHKLGSVQRNDKVVVSVSKFKGKDLIAFKSEDDKFLIVYSYYSTSRNNIYIKESTNSNSEFKAIFDGYNSENTFLGNDGNRMFFLTNLNAPNGRVVEIDYLNPHPDKWIDFIPESKHLMTATFAARKIFIQNLVDVKSKITQYNLKGKLENEIKLPGAGIVEGFIGKMNDKELYYTFTSHISPDRIYKYDVTSGKSELTFNGKANFDSEDYESKQVFYDSKDGTKIPMYILFKKGIKLDGKNPTLLYGYGGFNVSIIPYFDARLLVWLENGGIYASANLRGGGEYGQNWYEQGIKMKKQNVFDDFIAAAEYLINEKYTSPDFLALKGISNGGLLVGSVLSQRPDLFKVALPRVGVLDMLRYHKFTSGDLWDYDYGTADESKEMFQYLKNYSPYHSIKKNTAYPATLISTSDHDDRVVPGHSFKFTAALQDLSTKTNPILLRVETNSGHSSVNLSKDIDLFVDEYSFTWYNMGIEPKFEDNK